MGGSALKAAIGQAIGQSQIVYEADKRKEMLSLGFEKLPRELNMTFSVSGEDELLGVFLGKTRIPVSDLHTYETRFGIKLETNDLPGVRDFQFNPIPQDTCEVTIRRDRYSDPATYRGEVYFPPRVGQKVIACIKTKMFELIVSGDKLSFNSKEVSADKPVLSPSEWRNFFLMADALANGNAILEIKPGNRKIKRIKQTIQQEARL